MSVCCRKSPTSVDFAPSLSQRQGTLNLTCMSTMGPGPSSATSATGGSASTPTSRTTCSYTQVGAGSTIYLTCWHTLMSMVPPPVWEALATLTAVRSHRMKVEIVYLLNNRWRISIRKFIVICAYFMMTKSSRMPM